MSNITRFSELSASFRLCDAQLRVALAQGDSIRRPASLLRLTATLMERISEYEPGSITELDEMIDFYAARRLDHGCRGSEFDRVGELLTQHRHGQLPDRENLETRRMSVPDPLPEVIEGRELARLVTDSAGRLAAVGVDLRFLAISAAEAAFHRMPPGKIAGKHLLDVIGCGHQQVRKKQRLELALSGRAQDYEYPFANNGAPVSLRIRCNAVQDGYGLTYAALIHAEEIDAADARGSEVA